jgi:hypothetical protein
LKEATNERFLTKTASVFVPPTSTPKRSVLISCLFLPDLMSLTV